MRVHAKIQKWGNGLALRISGAVREVPHFKEGTEVDIEVSEEGFTVTKSRLAGNKRLPFKESELLDGISPKNAHADLLAAPLSSEIE